MAQMEFPPYPPFARLTKDKSSPAWAGCRRIFFQHMQKTGGTTIVALLKNFFLADDSCQLGGLPGWRPQKYRRAAHATFVHDNSDVLYMRTPGAFAFTFVRDPFDRLLSARRQWTDASDEDLSLLDKKSAAVVVAMRSMSLDRILDQVFDHPMTIPLFWNHQVVSLGLPRLAKTMFEAAGLNSLDTNFNSKLAYRQWLERNRRNILDSAIANVRSLDYIGLFEQFDESTREVFACLGLPLPVSVPRLNARAAHKDESNAGLKERSTPFIDLDQELYNEVLEIRARTARSNRGAPADYIRRSIDLKEDRTFKADEPPGGHGWRLPNARADGAFSRWTGPSRQSHFQVGLAQGRYRLEVSIMGGVSMEALLSHQIFVDGVRIATQLFRSKDDTWLIEGEFLNPSDRPVDVCLEAGEIRKGFGLETSSIRLTGEQAIGFPESTASGPGFQLVEAQAAESADHDIFPGSDQTFSVRGVQDGAGWHSARLTADGRFTRWTGPGTVSEIAFRCSPGSFGLEVVICGAVSAETLRGTRLSIDGEYLHTAIKPGQAGRYVATAIMTRVTQSALTLGIAVPETRGGYGLEVEAVRVFDTRSRGSSLHA